MNCISPEEWLKWLFHSCKIQIPQASIFPGFIPGTSEAGNHGVLWCLLQVHPHINYKHLPPNDLCQKTAFSLF